MANLAEFIQQQLGEIPEEEARELILDNFPCAQLTALTGEYVNLERLSAVSCGLTTLNGFPNLPRLRILDLGGNNLTDADLVYLAGCTALTNLKLCNNNINHVISLEPLGELENLRRLELAGCDVCYADGCRESVFEMCHALMYLDNLDINNTHNDSDDSDNSELEEDEDEEIGGRYSGDSGEDDENEHAQ